jgi:hypothetical protein
VTIQYGEAALRPTPHAKRLMADGLYHRGQHFIAAAILLHQREGHEYVVWHLLCQGIEIVLKALLLLRDFDKYQPLLKGYRHDLMLLASDALREFKCHPLRPAVSHELKELNCMYSQHLLRYDLLTDVLVDPNSISGTLVFRRLGAVLRLAARERTRTKPL